MSGWKGYGMGESPLRPDWSGVPEVVDAEPGDAEVDHAAGVDLDQK